MKLDLEHVRPLRLIAAAAMAVATIAIAGCNTVEGAGQDVEAAGEGVQDMSRDARD